jgi:hypothetical protein
VRYTPLYFIQECIVNKVVMGIAAIGLVSHLSAADLAGRDLAFLFGQSDVNVVAMSSMEMVQTEGQLLDIIGPVFVSAIGPALGLVTSLPVAGPLAGDLMGDLFLAALPIAGPLVGKLYAVDLLGTATGLVESLPAVGAIRSVLPVLGTL